MQREEYNKLRDHKEVFTYEEIDTALVKLFQLCSEITADEFLQLFCEKALDVIAEIAHFARSLKDGKIDPDSWFDNLHTLAKVVHTAEQVALLRCPEWVDPVGSIGVKIEYKAVPHLVVIKLLIPDEISIGETPEEAHDYAPRLKGVQLVIQDNDSLTREAILTPIVSEMYQCLN